MDHANQIQTASCKKSPLDPLVLNVLEPSDGSMVPSHSPALASQQAEMDALVAAVGLGKKSEAYALVQSSLAEDEVQKVLATRCPQSQPWIWTMHIHAPLSSTL